MKQEKELSKQVFTRGHRSVGTSCHSWTQPNIWKANFANGYKYSTLSCKTLVRCQAPEVPHKLSWPFRMKAYLKSFDNTIAFILLVI